MCLVVFVRAAYAPRSTLQFFRVTSILVGSASYGGAAPRLRLAAPWSCSGLPRGWGGGQKRWPDADTIQKQKRVLKTRLLQGREISQHAWIKVGDEIRIDQLEDKVSNQLEKIASTYIQPLEDLSR